MGWYPPQTVLTSSRLIKTLAALNDPQARELRLGSLLRSSPVGESVCALDEVIGRGGGGGAAAGDGATDPDVTLLALASWLCREGESGLVLTLRNTAVLDGRRRLLRVLQRELEAEWDPDGPNEVRVPDYRAGRELTLGERKAIARQPGREMLKKLARDPHPRVVRELLGNPHLTETQVIEIVARRPAIREVTVEVVLSPKWLARPRVRLTIILNPGSPIRVSAPMLPLCNREDLRLIASSPSLPEPIRAAAAQTRADRDQRGSADGDAGPSCHSSPADSDHRQTAPSVSAPLHPSHKGGSS